MDTFNKLVSTVSDLFEFNEATLSGCVDIIIIKQKDGSFKGTGFHARFGKVHVIKSKDRIVKIEINGKPTNITMKLGEYGEAYFEEEVADDEVTVNPVQKNKRLTQDERKIPSIEDLLSTTKKGRQSRTSTRDTKVDIDTEVPPKKMEIVNPPETPQEETKSKGIFDAIRGIFTKDNKPKNQLKIERIVSSKLTPDIDEIGLIQAEKEHEIEAESVKKTSTVSTNAQIDSDQDPGSPLKYTNQVSSPKNVQNYPPVTRTQNKGTRVRKVLRLSSEKIKQLNLRPGQNTITYIIDTGLQGTHKLNANIYLWSYNSKLIVTDVDGTITRSDVLGAILPMLGKDWTQPGIAPLFANIHRNGYHILYLSSRAIGQIGFTRHFVKTVSQDDHTLPVGPIISSPDLLLPCFKREIVFSKPEYFKSAALRDIRNLFPPDENPFHAGFGNRENDAVAYRFIGIPLENIFTANGEGDIRHAAHTLYRSYSHLNAKVKDTFPFVTCLLNHYHSTR